MKMRHAMVVVGIWGSAALAVEPAEQAHDRAREALAGQAAVSEVLPPELPTEAAEQAREALSTTAFSKKGIVQRAVRAQAAELGAQRSAQARVEAAQRAAAGAAMAASKQTAGDAASAAGQAKAGAASSRAPTPPSP